MNKVHDIVCGMTIDEDDAAGESTWKGETYHFCSIPCKAAFDSDPDGYVSGEKGIHPTEIDPTR